MDKLVFDIDKLAIEHYKHRLLMFIEKKENAEIKPILQKQTEGLLELLDEIYECFDKHDSDQRRNQWDRKNIPVNNIIFVFFMLLPFPSLEITNKTCALSGTY